MSIMRVYKLKRNFDCVSCLFLFIQFYKWNDQLIALVRIEIIKKEIFFFHSESPFSQFENNFSLSWTSEAAGWKLWKKNLLYFAKLNFIIENTPKWILKIYIFIIYATKYTKILKLEKISRINFHIWKCYSTWNFGHNNLIVTVVRRPENSRSVPEKPD